MALWNLELKCDTTNLESCTDRNMRNVKDSWYSIGRKALCLTAFMQTTLLFVGLLTWKDHMLLAIGIMMSAAEVPKIAERFGLDTSVRFNMISAVHMTSTAVSLARTIAK